MRITMVYGARNDGQVNILRMLDGRRRRLVISCPAQMSPAEILRAAMRQLTDDEATELAEALGLKQQSREEKLAEIARALDELRPEE